MTAVNPRVFRDIIEPAVQNSVDVIELKDLTAIRGFQASPHRRAGQLTPRKPFRNRCRVERIVYGRNTFSTIGVFRPRKAKDAVFSVQIVSTNLNCGKRLYLNNMYPESQNVHRSGRPRSFQRYMILVLALFLVTWSPVLAGDAGPALENGTVRSRGSRSVF